MPLQWLPLQQRQQQGQTPQQRSPISQALKPQQRQFLGTMDTSNRFVDEQKAKWAEEDKLRKQERDSQTNKAQELGMRVGEAIQGQQQGAMAQQQQQAAANKQIESNPEPAAKEMYELLKTLPDEAKSQLLNQIFTPTAPSGTISSAGKQVTMPEKYNPIAGIFLEKGWAMFDAKGNVNLSEPEREFEKGTFEIVEKGGRVYEYNTATGEEELLFIPDNAYFDSSEAAMKGTPDYPELDKKTIMVKKGEWKVEYSKKATPKQTSEEEMTEWNKKQFGTFKRHMLSGINDLGFMIDPGSRDKYLSMTYEEYMQFMQGEAPERFGDDIDMGEGESVTSNSLFDKILNKIGLQRTPKETKTFEGGQIKVGGYEMTGSSYSEENVSDLLRIIPDNLSATQRADLIKQGATDADIDEALKRKKR